MESLITEGKKEAKLFIDKMMVDTGTMKQIRSMVRHDAIEQVRIMPDCHKGNGCCIGFTSHLINKIVPNFVGGDIGCGIVSYPLDLHRGIKPKSLNNFIKSQIPLGSEIYQQPVETIDIHLERIYQLANEEVLEFCSYYQTKFGVDISLLKPTYDMTWLLELSQRIKTDMNYDLRSLGTLGGGNHFIEVEKSDINDKEYLTVHSGSRNLGQKVCRYHQDIITNGREVNWEEFDTKMKHFKRDCQDKKEIKRYKDKIRKEMMDARHPEYLEEEEAIKYYLDMIFCQKYALVNREIILETILESLGLPFTPENKIESIHNYIDFTDFIIRKGAIQANPNQKCIISLNMKDGILLCQGKGNEDWNMSSAHGAGRVLTRQHAQSKLSLRKFEQEMKESGVYSTSIGKNTIDEAPDCYKDTELIKTLVEPSVEILEQLKPILNVKGI